MHGEKDERMGVFKIAGKVEVSGEPIDWVGQISRDLLTIDEVSSLFSIDE